MRYITVTISVGCHCENPSPRNTYILSQCLTHYQTSRWHLKRLNFDFNLYLEYYNNNHDNDNNYIIRVAHCI